MVKLLVISKVVGSAAHLFLINTRITSDNAKDIKQELVSYVRQYSKIKYKYNRNFFMLSLFKLTL